MSETSEVPLTPQETGEPPQIKRLEDMEEFKALAPEQQKQALEIRERIRNEAMDPQAVVSRSINEMGFFEGLKETVKPHLAKQKEILFKELKANASLALSLVPVLGEGKGLGSGLFGITAKRGKELTGMSRLKNVQFEPFVRIGKAVKAGKKEIAAVRKFSAVDKLRKIYRGKNVVDANQLKVAAEKFGAKSHDALRPITSIIAGKNTAAHVLGKEFSVAAKEGATAIATNFHVEGIQAAQRAKAAMKTEAYQAVKIAVREVNAADKGWYKFPLKWGRTISGEFAAHVAKARVGKEFGKGVTKAVNEAVHSTNPLVKPIEGLVKRAAPTAIEATKFGKFHAFFDRWLNLTPDVPMWLSTTTGVAEFLGAHGIDAIPAVLQIAHNRYKQVMVTKDMALDVLGYTASRAIGKVLERKQAAEVFTSAAVPAAS